MQLTKVVPAWSCLARGASRVRLPERGGDPVPAPSTRAMRAAHGGGAEAHSEGRAGNLGSGVLALALSLGACADSHSETGAAAQEEAPAAASGSKPPLSSWTGGRAPSPAARAQIDELVTALTPLRPDLTSDILDRHYWKQLEVRERLRTSGDADVGIAALRAYVEYRGEETLVRQGLLEVAAHAAPEESRELLKTLMLEYGYPIDDRTYATQYLAETSPEVYLAAAETYVTRRGRPTKTMPNDEFLVRGWITACAKTGRSPVPELASVATNLHMEDAARHLATEELGRHRDPLGRKALETVLVESSGNGYIRRKAAQSLHASLPAETACTMFRYVLEHEADLNFRAFLEDMVERFCR